MSRGVGDYGQHSTATRIRALLRARYPERSVPWGTYLVIARQIGTTRVYVSQVARSMAYRAEARS